ncbi:MAG: type VI secretion protein IcmF/TssM N-terminal domain-containing protein, partial [Gammaproteobacteria bacterium]
MKLTKTLHRFKHQLVSQIPGDAYLKSLPSFGLFAIAAVLIWIAVPHIAINDQMPFASVEKRSYLTAFLFLIWILKFLMFDLDGPNPFQYKDLHTRKKLYSLQKRVLGVVSFLKKTTISRLGKTISLTELPWYLLIGPNDAGKTSLLANADVHYVLQRQLKPDEDPQHLNPSEQCDWWVTKDACLIDVPGKYISPPNNQHQATSHGIFWRFFLQLIKKQRGKHGIDGIILAMPLAEIMKEGNSKKQQAAFQHLLSRIYELQRQFPAAIPCYLVITKCDLLSGFSEFFAEAGKEEINQPWGFSLPISKNLSKLDMLCVQRFNALIKKINQQLLWRLHQERNPMARPYIKDFPLQIEKLKEFTLDLIKKLSSANALPALQGVYLTSALQVKPESVILEEAVNNAQRAIQLFKPPASESRSYFIKQFMMNALNDQPSGEASGQSHLKRYVIYALAITAVTIAGIFLGRDFKQGVNQTYVVENKVADYQAEAQHISNPVDHLSKTIDLLNSLQPEVRIQPNEFKLTQLLAFYSTKSQKRNARVYQDALKNILLPEVKNYLAHYIVIPVNRNADNVYATLKAYIMLGDTNHFQANYIIDTFNFILPNNTNPVLKKNLADHFHTALYSNWTPMGLNMTLIQDTRNYLTALPAHQLGELILKNIN